MDTEPYKITIAESNHDVAKIMGNMIQDVFRNQLLVGDLHSPMNEVSAIYKISGVNGEILSGFTIYKGNDVPVLIFPARQISYWSSIKDYVDMNLKFDKIMVIYPVGLSNDEENLRHDPPPILGWESYLWIEQNLDVAMRLESKDIEVPDINDLPTIRAATIEDTDLIELFLPESETWFNPLQLKSELSVICESDDDILGFAGTHFETPYTVQLGNVYVKEGVRNQGIGRALTVAVTLGIIKTKRVPTLFVNEKNTVARGLYKKIGFKEYDRFVFYLGVKK